MQIYISVIEGVMEIFKVFESNYNELSKLLFRNTERIRNEIKKYVNYSSVKSQSFLSSCQKYGELLEVSYYLCELEIFHEFRELEEKMYRPEGLKERLVDIVREYNSTYLKFYVKPALFGKNGRLFIVMLTRMYGRMLSNMCMLNNENAYMKCIKELKKSFNMFKDTVSVIENRNVISKEVVQSWKELVVFYEVYLHKERR